MTTQPAPPTSPAASSTGSRQHAAHATPASPVKPDGSTRRRSTLGTITPLTVSSTNGNGQHGLSAHATRSSQPVATASRSVSRMDLAEAG
ncbi:hypothetical protein ACQEVC_24975 [Plantactinospora sp. CA-294935]|uniref:hypothetical protein n=1 Tax=Plantactinospora sp. CA-294935 TaxID=3240012 RepID=UPI003D8B4140